MSRAVSARRPRRSLARLDWIEAGQRLLIDGGLPAIRLAALTRELGVTSGSFYHHFTDFREYLGELADYYGGENIERLREAIAPIPEPAQRLRLLLSLRDQWDIARLDAAMRVWARNDERARDAVARLDDKMLEIIREQFTALGFSGQEARLRALLSFCAGIGQEFLFGRPTGPDDTLGALELLIGR